MFYQLPNGKVIDISLDEILNMDLENIQYYMSLNAGIDINNQTLDPEDLDDCDEEYTKDEILKIYFPEDNDDDNLDIFIDYDFDY
jgi:hypothetical protein